MDFFLHFSSLEGLWSHVEGGEYGVTADAREIEHRFRLLGSRDKVYPEEEQV